MKRSILAPVGLGLLGLGAVVAYLLLPPSRDAEWLVTLTQLASAGAIVGAILVRRPVRPVPWALVAVGIAFWAIASVAGADEVVASSSSTFPGGSQAASVLAYPALFVATIGFTSDRRHFRDLLAGSEPIIYTISLTALMWLAITGPYVAGHPMPLGSAAWVWIPVLLDLLLAMLAWRRVEPGDESRQLFEAMILAYVVAAAVHTATGYAAQQGGLEAGGFVAGARMVAPMLLALIAASPAFTSTTAANAPTMRAHWTQFLGLVAASLVPLGALILMLFGPVPSTGTILVVSAAAVCVIVLALGRTWRLVEQVGSLTEQRGQDRLAAMVEHSSDIVVLCDENGRIGYVSPGLRTTLGHDPEIFVGHQVLDLIAPPDRDHAARQLRMVMALGNGGTVEFEATMVHVGGEPRCAVVIVANLTGSSAVDGIVVTIRDITEQRELERQLSHRAYHDELTGLANRALFLARLDDALRATRHDTDPVVVLFVDLDDFKSINDALGHVAGDHALRVIAERIRDGICPGDTAARLGGDEFAVLVADGGLARAEQLAARLIDDLREPVVVDGAAVAALASVGVAVAAPGTTTTDLLRDADAAMYEAKRAGKARVRVCDLPPLVASGGGRVDVRADHAPAVDRDEPTLVYVPFADLRSGRVCGATAFVHWHRRDRGDTAGASLVGVDERSASIVPVGYWALDQALRHTSTWAPGLVLALDVVPIQLHEPDFVTRVMAIIDDRGSDPSSVRFDVPGSAWHDDGVRDVVRRLRGHGVRVALDGLGLLDRPLEDALGRLRRDPVDLLAIDRAAIAELGADPSGAVRAPMIVRAAGALDVPTVADGIETPAELAELRRLGCRFGRGGVLSRPLDPDELQRRFGSVAVLAVT